MSLMKSLVLKYSVLIKKDGKFFVSYVPTLGISDFGKTVEEAQKNTKDAIQCHIEGLQKTNSEIPSPDTSGIFLSQTEVSFPAGLKVAF